jgi:protein gp37
VSTGISYCHETLNPIVGCSPDMPCAVNCWARRTVSRLSGSFPEYKVCLTPDGRHWSGEVLWRPKELDKLTRWKKGKRIFMVAQGDLFGPDVTDNHIAVILHEMMANLHHRYLILTKQTDRIVGMVRHYPSMPHVLWCISHTGEGWSTLGDLLTLTPQQRVGISFEPLLAPVSHLLTPAILKRLSWVVVGCLKLPGGKAGGWAADNQVSWRAEADTIAGLCRDAHVPCYLKQFPAQGYVYPGMKWNALAQEIPDFLTLPWERT